VSRDRRKAMASGERGEGGVESRKGKGKRKEEQVWKTAERISERKNGRRKEKDERQRIREEKRKDVNIGRRYAIVTKRDFP
jgi:hypothetical protein